MRNVKVGDIAIVVDGGYKRERQGMVVKVVAFKGRMSYEGSWLQPAWLIQAYGARPFGYEVIDGRTRQLSIVVMPDAYLRRLAPVGIVSVSTDVPFEPALFIETTPSEASNKLFWL